MQHAVAVSAQRPRWELGNFQGKAVGFGQCVRGLNHPLDQPDTQRFFGGHRAPGEDQVQGSALAAKRLENVMETLNRLTIEPERVLPVEIEISEYDRIPEIVGDFVDRVRKLGSNPYKF